MIPHSRNKLTLIGFSVRFRDENFRSIGGAWELMESEADLISGDEWGVEGVDR